MTTLAQVRNDRVKYLKSLKPLYRTLDGKIEATERELKRTISRKRAFPEPDDLARISKLTNEIATALANVVKTLNKGYPQ